MAYIGNEPSVNFTSFAKQDITGDGGASYTLTHAVANANEIEVFVNNVRQEPTSAYSVSGTALTMTGNVASTDDFYVIYLGKALQTVVPPDASVGTAKIVDSAVTNAKIADDAGIAGSKLGTGAVLQVVSTSYSTALNTQSTTYVSTGMSLSITPQSTSSKILVRFNVPAYINANTYHAYYTVFRGTVSGTNLATGSGTAMSEIFSVSGGELLAHASGEILDSPSTASEVTYTVGFKVDTGSALASAFRNNQQGNLTLMEIGA